MVKYKERKRLRILGKVLFVCYVLFIIYFLLFSEWYGRTGEMSEYRYNLTNVVGNVVIFVPFGFFMPMASKYRSFFMTVCYSFGLSLCVEVFQLLTRVGSFDVDDLLLNTIGGLAGYILFVICNAIRRRYHAKK